MSLPELDCVDTLRKFTLLAKRGHKGRFVCGNAHVPGCGKILNDILYSLPNDAESHSFKCPGCHRVIHISAGILAFIFIKRTQEENIMMGDLK